MEYLIGSLLDNMVVNWMYKIEVAEACAGFGLIMMKSEIADNERCLV